MDLQNLSDACLSPASLVISKEGKSQNLVLSPLSLRVAIEMIEALKHRQINSSKAAEILSPLLAGGAAPFGGVRLSYANGVWIDQCLELKPEFQQSLHNTFKAACAHVDFIARADEVRDEVNTWVEKETNGLIKEVLPIGSVNSSTELIASNAIYFKGMWHEKFNATLTKNDNFFLQDGTSVEVPFMSSTNSQIVAASDTFKVLRLLYARTGRDNCKFSMYIYLPNQRDGLPALIERMGSEPGFLDKRIEYGTTEVGKIRIPKFEIDFRFEADSDEVFKSLAMNDPKRPRIFHKSFIKVNEEGTEAAAATMAEWCAALYPFELEFVVDHPFLFVIREDTTGAVLFVGQVLNPLGN